MGFRDGSRIGTGSLGEEAIIVAMTSFCGDVLEIEGAMDK